MPRPEEILFLYQLTSIALSGDLSHATFLAHFSKANTCFQSFFMLITTRPVRFQAKVPALALGKTSQRQRREHVRTCQRAEALPDMRPLHIAAKQLREVTSGKVPVHHR